MSVKNIIVNMAALTTKYGAANMPVIQAALAPLIAHDRANGIVTKVYDVSDPRQMAAINAPVVKDRTSASEFKATFDAIIGNTNPNFSMIIGAGDVVPLVPLVNTVDSDPIVPSDLPYACAAGYSTNPANFLAPSRILTRLPDINGGRDPNYLAGLLRTPVSYRAVASAALTATYLSPGCAQWQAELEGALPSVFGNSTYLALCPPNGPDWSSTEYQQLMHYVNTHGSDNSPDFSGQLGTVYPVAMTSPSVAGRLSQGMVGITACCYSAQLWNPFGAGANAPLPMANVYLASGAILYFGSSMICYGGSAPYNVPTNANMAASVFANRILAGDTTGAAMLATWQALSAAYSRQPSPVLLKTLVEFTAFGDVSTAPVDTSLAARVATVSDPEERAAADGRIAANFQAAADQLAVPIGEYVPVAQIERSARIRADIDAILRGDGRTPIEIRTLEWRPSDRLLTSVREAAAHRVHIVTARDSEDSIFEADQLYEIVERSGVILDVRVYPRR